MTYFAGGCLPFHQLCFSITSRFICLCFRIAHRFHYLTTHLSLMLAWRPLYFKLMHLFKCKWDYNYNNIFWSHNIGVYKNFGSRRIGQRLLIFFAKDHKWGQCRASCFVERVLIFLDIYVLPWSKISCIHSYCQNTRNILSILVLIFWYLFYLDQRFVFHTHVIHSFSQNTRNIIWVF